MLEGEIEVEVGGEKHLLSQGDFMWFESRLKHRIRNQGTEKSAYFYVNVPSV